MSDFDDAVSNVVGTTSACADDAVYEAVLGTAAFTVCAVVDEAAADAAGRVVNNAVGDAVGGSVGDAVGSAVGDVVASL